MTTFTATLEPLDPTLVTPDFTDIVKQIAPGTMLVLTFPAGTIYKEIHLVQRQLLNASARYQGCGKLKSHKKDTTLYVWLTSDDERIAALTVIQMTVNEKVTA